MAEKIQKPKYYIKAKYPMSAEEEEINKATGEAGLHVKHEWQIAAMLESHSKKLDKVKEDLENRLNFPQYYEKIYIDSKKVLAIDEATRQNKVITKLEADNLISSAKADHVNVLKEEISFYTEYLEHLNNIVGLLYQELQLRLDEKVDRAPLGTTYYCDPDTASGQLTGTWTFTNFSTSVTTGASADGNAQAELAVGDYVKVSTRTNWYKVTSVTDDNNFVINSYQEATITDSTNSTDYRDVSVAVGTSVANSFVVLGQFTETARSAGDELIVRGNLTNAISETNDLTFTSDGNKNNPIVIKRDYGDEWSSHVNISGTATATLTFGSKTVTFSADVSGVIAAGDWIYVSGDNNEEYAYEVLSVSTVTVTLYRPYKGNQAGSGKTVINMGSNPIWGTTNYAYQVNIDNADYWKIQGIHFTGTDGNGVVEIDTSYGHIFYDCIFQGNGSSDYGINNTDDASAIVLSKCRFYNCQYSVVSQIASGDAFMALLARDCYIDGNSISSSGGIVLLNAASWAHVHECEIENTVSADLILAQGTQTRKNHLMYARNCRLLSSNPISTSAPPLSFCTISDFNFNYGFEDYNGSIGVSKIYNEFSTLATVPFIQSEVTKVRAGGSAKSLKITPNDTLSNAWELSEAVLLEIPIYLTAASHTITIYFASDDNTDWDASPTATQLYLQVEAWGHASNIYRKKSKSSGSVDFTTDTNFDQSLSITFTPAAAGIVYLKVMYNKPKEATNANIFYVDPIPVIS